MARRIASMASNCLSSNACGEVPLRLMVGLVVNGFRLDKRQICASPEPTERYRFAAEPRVAFCE
jgi:hypothetical protein